MGLMGFLLVSCSEFQLQDCGQLSEEKEMTKKEIKSLRKDLRKFVDIGESQGA